LLVVAGGANKAPTPAPIQQQPRQHETKNNPFFDFHSQYDLISPNNE
jgi:hypothetical protein